MHDTQLSKPTYNAHRSPLFYSSIAPNVQSHLVFVIITTDTKRQSKQSDLNSFIIFVQADIQKPMVANLRTSSPQWTI